MSDSLWPHGLQHARPPCPSPSPRVCSDSCPLSQWRHPTTSSSVYPIYNNPRWMYPLGGKRILLGTWLIKNPGRNKILNVYMSFLFLKVAQVFFFLSLYGLWYGIRSHNRLCEVTQLIMTSKCKLHSEKRNSQGTDTLFNVSPPILKNLNQEIHFHVFCVY